MDELKKDEIVEGELEVTSDELEIEEELEEPEVEEEEELVDVASTSRKSLKRAELEKAIALEARMKQDDIEKKARLGK